MASDLFADPPVAQKALVEALARLPAALHLPEPERSRAAERPSGAHHHQRRSIDRQNCIGQPSGTLGTQNGARSAAGTGRVQHHGQANKGLQCLLVNRVVLAKVDGTPGVAIEAGIEEP